uniref:Proteoglycan 2, bone marrow n=1 Tax=Jaculus jaculus TaxID=51337 RepID=A0A8C5NWJ0_JACJA
MKFPLAILALLIGGVSARHLRSETSNFESFKCDETLPQEGEIFRQEVKESPVELTLPEEEEEGGSGGEGTPEDKEAVESDSALDVLDRDLQCPKEEDTVKLEGSPGCKTCRYLVVRKARNFNQAQSVCQRCYRGNLVSIHSFKFNFQIQCSIRALNQGQVWIGGKIVGVGHCARFHWVDGSSWNFAYWAAGQPQACGGRCVSMCTRGAQWRKSKCTRRLPFICSY